jgi:ligand-binding SRPBCC domain-containing protein
MRILFETQISLNYLKIKARFNRELFLFLKPPGVQLDLQRFDGCAPGDEVHLALNSFGIKQKWVSVMTAEKQDEKEWSFVDEGKLLPWPLINWKHHHRVLYLDDNSSKIIDDITFKCAYPWMEAMMYPVLWSTFAIRPARYRKFFQG